MLIPLQVGQVQKVFAFKLVFFYPLLVPFIASLFIGM